METSLALIRKNKIIPGQPTIPERKIITKNFLLFMNPATILALSKKLSDHFSLILIQN
jgi:hypothetical protein